MASRLSESPANGGGWYTKKSGYFHKRPLF